MHRSLHLLAAACVAGALVVSATTHSAAQERYESTEHGFAFTPPPGWACYGADGADDVVYQVAAYPRGTTGVPSLLIFVSQVDAARSAEEARDASLASLSDSPLRDRRRGRRRIGAREWPTILAEVTAPDGTEAHVEICYVRAPGTTAFVVTRTWAIGDDESARLLDAAIDSFEVTLDADEAPLRALAARCASGLPWADSWTQAAARARAERRLVAVVYEHTTAVQIPRMTASGPLSDPDVAALLDERFVLLRLERDDPAPFRDPRRYGLSEHAWGASMLFVTPDGDVLREAGAREPTFVDQVAREALAAAPDAVGPHRPRPVDPEAAARLALRRGELADVFTALGELDTPGAHRLRAAVHRRRRLARPALTCLAAARRALLSAPLDAAARRALQLEVDADEALVRLRVGKVEDAYRLWNRVASEPRSARAPEAMYWLGVLAVVRLRDLTGGGWWTRVTRQAPDDPWAWKAAANLLRTGAFMNGTESLVWPDADVLRDTALARAARRHTATAPAEATNHALDRAPDDAPAAATDDASDHAPDAAPAASRNGSDAAPPDAPDAAPGAASAPAADSAANTAPDAEDAAGHPPTADAPQTPLVDDPRDVVRQARRYLLQAQRPTGAWPCPTEELSLIRVGYGEAVTAICGTSLLPAIHEPDVRAAVDRALANVLRQVPALTNDSTTGAASALRTWARTYALRFLVRCAAADLGDRATLDPAIQSLVDSLTARQGAAGGWTYLVLPTDPEGDGLSASFLSAAVLLALCEAHDLGAAVPADALTRGADFLARLRDDDGTFRYAPDIPGNPRDGTHPEAAGRSPLCALALLRARALTAPDAPPDLTPLRTALEVFLTYRDELADQLGKDICHTGPAGQASYYFAFGHAYAADALLALPLPERSPLARRLSASLLAARLDDGTWVDMPGLGRPYATAMALLGLDGLLRARE